MPSSHRIAVVGFGMAGAVAAYLLARDGHKVAILERAASLGPIGAGVLLQASGQEILRRLNVLQRVADHAAPIDELFARQASGRTMNQTRFADFAPGTIAYGVHRGVLFTALQELVAKEKIDVRSGCAVDAREVASDGTVTLIDAAGRRHGPFDLVIGADGSRSRVRDTGGFDARVRDYAHGTLWMIAPGEGLPRRLLQVVKGPSRLFGLLPLGDGLVTLYWGLRHADYPAIKARGLPALKEEILAFAPEAEGVLSQVHGFEQLLLTGYRRVHVRRWDSGRVILIGDAAHAMSPHLGQGINLAMIDAWRLAEELRRHESIEAAFAAFQDRQRDYIRYYQHVTGFLAPFFQSDSKILALGRDVVLPLLPRVPWIRRQMAMTACGMKRGFLGGAIEI